MKSDPEELAARWLNGRGTKVLYFAIIFAILGTLMTGWSAAEAREKERAALELVSEVKSLCARDEFRVVNREVCVRAEQITGGGTGTSVGDVDEFVYVLDADGSGY